MQHSDIARRTGQFALVSGLLGLIGVGLLIAALAAPTPEPNTMRRETDFFLWQDAFVILQALAMMPVTVGIYRLVLDRGEVGKKSLALGLLAQASLVIATGLIFTLTVSDMLYMAPIGLVGIWLLTVNRARVRLTSPLVAWTGSVAGIGLILVGLGFLIYGMLVAPAIFVRPLSAAEIDAQTLTPANLFAHICLAIGTLLGRLIYPIWVLLFGRRLLRWNENFPVGL